MASINHTKCRRRRQTPLPFPSVSIHPRPLVLSFLLSAQPLNPSSSSPPPAPQRHRLRVIPAWAEISFFHPPSWRFAKIHSSPASEGAKGTPQKPARRMRKARERKRTKVEDGRYHCSANAWRRLELLSVQRENGPKQPRNNLEIRFGIFSKHTELSYVVILQ